MNDHDDNLPVWQRRYYLGMLLLAPLSPFLYLQGVITRWKVGLLPDAAGPTTGVAGEGDATTRLFVIGESTVAGLGARTHELALAGQFASQLSKRTGKRIEWHVIGKNGVTARRVIDELLPQMPDNAFDHILIGLGGNDVMKLSSPRTWRRDMIELISLLREKNPGSVIFITNCPMIVMSPVLPEPIKTILWRLSRMHDTNIRKFTREMERVFYYPQPANVTLDGFFADGIHPSEKGYSDWARAMMEYFSTHHKW